MIGLPDRLEIDTGPDARMLLITAGVAIADSGPVRTGAGLERVYDRAGRIAARSPAAATRRCGGSSARAWWSRRWRCRWCC